MVATTLTWNSDINLDLFLEADAEDQYRRTLLELHIWLKLAGWTVVFSSGNNNGAGFAADANDNITVLADVVFGTNTVEQHSYAVYQSPAGGEPFGVNGGTSFIMWDANVSSASTTPQLVNFFSICAPDSYVLAGAPLTTRPVATLLAREDTRSINFRPAAGFVPQHVHRWRNNRGELIFIVSTDGTGFAESALWLTSPDNTEGLNAFALYAANAGGGALIPVQFTSASNWNSHWIDGTIQNSHPGFVSASSFMTAWTAGQSDAATNPASAPIDFCVNSGINGRYFGRVVDMRATGPLLPPGTLDDSDTDGNPNRMMSVNGLLIPTDKTQAGIGITL